MYTVQKALQSQSKAKKPLEKYKNSDLKSMNNTKANGLKNDSYPKSKRAKQILQIKKRKILKMK